MAFDSLEFLLRFLPAILVLYFVLPKRFKNVLLVAVSLIFYAWGEPVYVVLLVAACAANYALAIVIGGNRGTLKAKWALVLGVLCNISLLGFFKYADLLIGTFNQLTGSGLGLLHLPLPVGISFYTFQMLSYVVDVYRGTSEAQKKPMELALYVTLFPQLLAGPIVRYQTMAPQIADREQTLEGFARGVHRFVLGLGKKVIIANNMAAIWEWARTTGQASVLSAWLGIVAFALQLYFDFSGYTDMAIGLGSMLGFRFPENFLFPYASLSVTEFWRRWHITLGQWFRDYLYIPLGGNRVSRWKWVRNLLVVWTLTGLWHGASWNFGLWGMYFGVLLACEKLFLGRLLRRTPSAVQHAYTLLAVLVSWVLFDLRSVSEILIYLGSMFGLRGIPGLNGESLYWLRSNAPLMMIAAIASTPVFSRVYERYADRSVVRMAVMPLVYVVVWTVSVAYVVDSSFRAFLYFGF